MWEGIRTCNLTIASGLRSPFDIMGLLAFLQAMPVLTELALNLLDPYNRRLESGRMAVHPVELPVKYFHLHARGLPADAVMKLILMPRVSEMYISFSGLHPAETEAGLRMLDVYPSITKLALTISGGTGPTIRLAYIVSKLAMLEILRISGQMREFDLDVFPPPPSLRVLHLELCDHLLSDNLPYLKDWVKHLKTIIVQQCRNLSEDAVKAHFPETTVEWHA